MKYICAPALLLLFALPVFAEQPASAPTLPSDFSEWRLVTTASCDLASNKKLSATTKVKESADGTTAVAIQLASLNGVLYSKVQVAYFMGAAVGAEVTLKESNGNWTFYTSEEIGDFEKFKEAELKFLGATPKEYKDCVARAK